jgi:hypothetical protein
MRTPNISIYFNYYYLAKLRIKAKPREEKGKAMTTSGEGTINM